MPFAKRGETSLYWEKHGTGPALILGAGLGGVGSYWTPNLPEFTSHFTVYLFDQRGTGKSSIQAVESIEQMSNDLIAVMDHAELDEAMYLGHSTGGAIGVATHHRYGDLCQHDVRRRLSATNPAASFADLQRVGGRSICAIYLPIALPSLLDECA
jgi:pimeloyl-ACP methyl ester carboxylesterase